MPLRTIDTDAEVFYELGRLQALSATIIDLVGDMPFERDGESVEAMYRLDALIRIADGMLKRVIAELEGA